MRTSKHPMSEKTANRIVLEVGFHTFKWSRDGATLIGKTNRTNFRHSERIVARALQSRTIYPPVDTRRVVIRFGARCG